MCGKQVKAAWFCAFLCHMWVALVLEKNTRCVLRGWWHLMEGFGWFVAAVLGRCCSGGVLAGSQRHVLAPHIVPSQLGVVWWAWSPSTLWALFPVLSASHIFHCVLHLAFPLWAATSYAYDLCRPRYSRMEFTAAVHAHHNTHAYMCPRLPLQHRSSTLHPHHFHTHAPTNRTHPL